MKRSLMYYIPIIGIGAYAILFMYSASMYPGGSRMRPSQVGFDWIHNYWCDLMGKLSFDGQVNASRPTAIAAWICVCTSILLIFWKSVEVFFPQGRLNVLFKITSVLAAAIGLFAFTDFHDLIVALCFPFGTITAIGLTIGLLKSDLSFFKHTIWVCLVLLSLSFFMYFTNTGLHLLGLTQKITLAVVMSWLLAFHIALFAIDNKTPPLFK